MTDRTRAAKVDGPGTVAAPGAERARSTSREPPPYGVALADRPRGNADGGTYVVQAGDTIASIARKVGVDVDALAIANAGKLRTWRTVRGDVQGFEANAELTIPRSAPAATGGSTLAKAAGAALAYVAGGLGAAWRAVTAPSPPKQDTVPPASAAPAPPSRDPKEVVEAHSRLGTFGKHGVRVTSTTRNPSKQLDILRGYCKSYRKELDTYVEGQDALRGALDWMTFETCGLADEDTWLPFFVTLLEGYRKGLGWPLVASPIQTTWTDRKGKTRTANASPHLKGQAMDVADGDLKVLAATIEKDVPEFAKAGPFPVSSTQIENARGQSLVHVNFAKPVFSTGEEKSEDKAPL